MADAVQSAPEASGARETGVAPDATWAGHVCITSTRTEQLVWRIPRLWELARDLPVELVPLATVEHYLRGHWGPDRPSGYDIARHARRIMEADLDYPIIFAAEGHLVDGTHRIAKAFALGLCQLKAVRFPVTPEPDERRPRVPSASST